MKRRVSVLSLIFCVVACFAQTARAAEQGTFNLHKFEQLIGKETYTLTRTHGEIALKSDFKFTDRGTAVPLTTTMTLAKDLTPQDFHLKGKISRFSSVLDDTIHGRMAGSVTIPAGENFFDIQ